MNKKPNFIKAIIFGAVAFIFMTLFWRFLGKPGQPSDRILGLGLDRGQKINDAGIYCPGVLWRARMNAEYLDYPLPQAEIHQISFILFALPETQDSEAAKNRPSHTQVNRPSIKKSY